MVYFKIQCCCSIGFFVFPLNLIIDSSFQLFTFVDLKLVISHLAFPYNPPPVLALSLSLYIYIYIYFLIWFKPLQHSYSKFSSFKGSQKRMLKRGCSSLPRVAIYVINCGSLNSLKIGNQFRMSTNH